MACAGEGSECSPSSGSDGEFKKFLSRVKTPKSTTCCTPRTQSNRRKDSAEDFFCYLESKYSSAKKERTLKVPGLPGKEAACPVSSLPPLESSDPFGGDDSVFVRSRPRGGPKTRPLARRRWTWRSSGGDGGGPASSSRKGPGAAARDSSGSSTSEGEGGAAKEHPRVPRGTAKSWQPRAKQAMLGSGSSEEEEEEELDSLLVRLKNRMTFPSDSATAPPAPHKSPAALPPPSAPRAPISAQDPRKSKALVDVTQAHSAQRRSSCQIKGCFLKELSNSDSQQSKCFQSEKEELAQKLYVFYNSSVFEQQLPEQMEIIWNRKMRKTAGCCVTGQRKGPEEEGPRYARIMLSEKVCDSADRLRDTLIHELCHAAAWLIHGVRDGHGRFWSLYAKKSVLVHPELPLVSRCHNYEIKYKFVYECSRCKNTIGRHSRSLDTQRCVCALCSGQLVLCQPKRKDGTPAKKTPLAPFVKPTKGIYTPAKPSQPGLSRGAVVSLDFFAAQRRLLSP